MVLHISGATVPLQPVTSGVTRQPLFPDRERSGRDVVFDRIAVAAGETFEFDVGANSLIWFQVLGGEGMLVTPYAKEPLSDSVSVTLPPGVQATLSTDKGLSFLQAEILDLAKLDHASAANPPRLIATEWDRENVFTTKDLRKRIQLIVPAINNTNAFKADIVIYPPGLGSQTVHREGAETFVYVIRGRGTATAGGQRAPIREGDLLHFPDREPHSLQASAGDGEFRFLQFTAPGTFKTVFADARNVSTWAATGFDIRGRLPTGKARERWAAWWS